MKKVVRHESNEQFFERMHELAQKIDRGESVQACESISFEDIAQMKAFLATLSRDDDVELMTEDIDKLPPERQAALYRERLLQIRRAVISSLPIVSAHDGARRKNQDDVWISHHLKRLVDLNEGIVRRLYLPSWTLSANGLSEDLSKEELWSACLDLVMEMNREYGVTTASSARASSAANNVFNFGKTAHDPMAKPEPVRHTLVFRVLAMIFGQERLQRFVNTNSQYYKSAWHADVADPSPRPIDSSSKAGKKNVK